MLAVAIPAAAPSAALATLAVAAFALFAAGSPRLLVLLRLLAWLLGLDHDLIVFLDDGNLVLGLFRLDIGRQAPRLDKALGLLGQRAAEDRIVLRANRVVGLDCDG